MSKIWVALRVRPLSEREKERKCQKVVSVYGNHAFVTDIKVLRDTIPLHAGRIVLDSRARLREFQFDRVFWLSDDGILGDDQTEIYEKIAPPVERHALNGYNACLLAYGQSGSGKTHTMIGTMGQEGLIPRICSTLWRHMKSANFDFKMEVSFMEIYREKAKDLLRPNNTIKLREHPQHGPIVQNLTKVLIIEGALEEFHNILSEGEKQRAAGTTGYNGQSSRSHAIWTIYCSRLDNETPNKMVCNRLHLVDLAGSEKADLTCTKNILAEGADINRSLVALGNVISSLAERAAYIPYRDSALTWLLKDSLGGNAFTSIIITASPASSSHGQTLNSLRFAERARLVENKPRINSNWRTDISLIASSPSLVMSALELKKDIARLSSLIRKAEKEKNGGLLKGMAPKSGWNRFISALEDWNQHARKSIDKKKGKKVDNRDKSIQLSRSQSQELAVRRPSSDAMIQADLISCSSTPKSSRSSRKFSTEYFIPTTESFKCLTWKQAERKQLLMLHSNSASDEEEYENITYKPHNLLAKKTEMTKGRDTKIFYPKEKYNDLASLIREKIQGSIAAQKTYSVQPSIVPSELENPLIGIRWSTSVQEVPSSEDLDISCPDGSEDEFLSDGLCPFTPVCFKGFENMYRFVNEKYTCREFVKQKNPSLSPFEEILESNAAINHSTLEERVVSSPMTLVRSRSVSLSSVASSSSYDSIDIPRSIYPLQMAAQSEAENITELTDSIPLSQESTSLISPHYQIRKIQCNPSNNSRALLAAANPSSFFSLEIDRMNKLGGQIKKLKELCETLKCYAPGRELANSNRSGTMVTPSKPSDEAIESCSGWDISVEAKKVEDEIKDIEKIIRSNQFKNNQVRQTMPVSSSTSVASCVKVHGDSSNNVTSGNIKQSRHVSKHNNNPLTTSNFVSLIKPSTSSQLQPKFNRHTPFSVESQKSSFISIDGDVFPSSSLTSFPNSPDSKYLDRGSTCPTVKGGFSHHRKMEPPYSSLYSPHVSGDASDSPRATTAHGLFKQIH